MDQDIVVGIHAVKALLEAHPERVTTLLVDEGRVDARLHEIIRIAEAARIAVRRMPRRKLDQLAAGERHQGVAVRCQPLPVRGEAELREHLDSLKNPPLILVLDSVQDPHNLGACLRTADAAGVDAVVVPINQTSPVTATVRRAASGAVESVPFFQVKNLARAMAMLQERGVWIVGAAGETEAELYATDLTGPLALVLGAEGSGLRRLTREHCDQLVRIPMLGSVESLNVSVATGVLVFEALRQRRATPKS
jgi:predicted rRNA methylase